MVLSGNLASNFVYAVLHRRSSALKLGAAAFLTELGVVLAAGKLLVDWEAAAPIWAVLIPLGIIVVVVGGPAVLPGRFGPRRLLAGALLYTVVGAYLGLSFWSIGQGDEINIQGHEAVIAGLAWPVMPFLWLLQAMHDGLGWYS